MKYSSPILFLSYRWKVGENVDLDSIECERDSEGFMVLKPKYSTLYTKTKYLTKKQIVIDRIYEYDIRSANTSALKMSGKIDRKILDGLEKVDKKQRERAVGKMIQKNRNIWKIISKEILRAREYLFRMNMLQDDDILAIKNDAVFVIGRKLKYTKYGEMEFRCKNQYILYHMIEGIEMYYSKRDDKLDMKGVSDDVVEHPDQQEGMIRFLKTVFKYLSMDQKDELRSYLIEFTHNYKGMKLPYQYYRELNGSNLYRTNMELSGFSYDLTMASNDDLDIINPVYNYTRYILPLLRLYL